MIEKTFNTTSTIQLPYSSAKRTVIPQNLDRQDVLAEV